MATYFLWSGATGTGSGANWTNAFTTYTAALAAATLADDIIKVHKTHTEELATDTAYTHQNHIEVICVDKDASDALATMGTSAWIGHSTSNRGIEMRGAFRVYLYGVTFRIAGSTGDSMQLAQSDGAHFVYENCYLWIGNTNAASLFTAGGTDAQAFLHLKNSTLRFGATTQSLRANAKVLMEGGSVSPDGSAPSAFVTFTQNDPAGCTFDAIGVDLSHLGSNNLAGNATTSAAVVRFSQCKLGTSFVLLATQTNLNRSSAEVYIFDCASGDTHGLFGYANAMGSVVNDTGIYFTSSPNSVMTGASATPSSWKIVTTPNCSLYTPFETPWLGYYNSTLSAITPYVEILRDGSATAYQDDEVWLDVMAKTNSGSTQSSLTTDRMTLLGTPANQDAGAGLGSWTGESGTAWSGKLQVASLTPAEVGHIQARIVVGEPSVTVYADPLIRT